MPKGARPRPPSPAPRAARRASASSCTSTAATTPGWRGCPGQRQTLIAVLDDATKRLLYAQLWPEETTHAVMTALRAVLARLRAAHGPLHRPGRLGLSHPHGRRPRGSHPPHRRRPGPGPPRASSTSPATRPRPAAGSSGSTAPCRAASSTSSAWRASRRSRRPTPTCASSFIADYNREFTRPPADPARPSSPSARPSTSIRSSPRTGERLVGRDNVVSFEGLALQLAKQPGRRSCAGLRVPRAAAPQWRAHRLARPAVPGPLRRPGPAAGRPPPPSAKAPSAAPPRPVRPPGRRTPARIWLRRQSFDAGRTGISPRSEARRAAAAGPGSRSAPESKRTDYVSKPSGHFIC